MNKSIQFQDLGLKDYKETWDLQEEIFKKTVAIKVMGWWPKNWDSPSLIL